MKKQAQSQKILAYLKAGNTLTAREASKMFNCDRLAARVNDLRNSGHLIATEKVNRNGKQFARYSLGGRA